jgi:hypothetical protein
MGGWFGMELGCVKFGIGCRHFKASSIIFSGRLGNLCCVVARFGCSVVINEYSSFWMLLEWFSNVWIF